MNKILYTPKTIRKAKSYEMNPEEMAFVDLLSIGWDRRDAYMIAFRDYTMPTDMIEKTAKEIAARLKAKERIEDVKNGYGASEVSNDSSQSTITKEQVVADLIDARNKQRKGSKEWLELTKTIADIMRMKQDEIQTEDTTVHFYLPLTCNRCAALKSYNK